MRRKIKKSFEKCVKYTQKSFEKCDSDCFYLQRLSPCCMKNHDVKVVEAKKVLRSVMDDLSKYPKFISDSQINY